MDIEYDIEANSFAILQIQYDPTLSTNKKKEAVGKGYSKVGYFGEND